LFSSGNNDEDFGRERYLPVNPRVIWEETKDILRPLISEDTYKNIEKHITDMISSYNQNFKTYGIKLMRSGNVTLQYSKRWIFYMMLNNSLEKGEDLKIYMGGEDLSEEDTARYLKKFLELSKKVRVIIEKEENLPTVLKLKEEFKDKLDVRYFPNEVTGFMRNFVFGKELAFTGMKILSEEENVSYVGTAYVDLEDIDEISRKFENLWNLGKPV